MNIIKYLKNLKLSILKILLILIKQEYKLNILNLKL
jgi:hypothetical protein